MLAPKVFTKAKRDIADSQKDLSGDLISEMIEIKEDHNNDVNDNLIIK